MTYDDAIADLRRRAYESGTDIRFCALLWEPKRAQLVPITTVEEPAPCPVHHLPLPDVLEPAAFTLD